VTLTVNHAALQGLVDVIVKQRATGIKKAAEKLTGAEFALDGSTVTWPGNEGFLREYGDGTNPPQPWATEAILRGGGGQHEGDI
jgi:hypothetical protein